MDYLAPRDAPGWTQIVSSNQNSQVYISDDAAKRLVLFGLIYYEAEYGPNARVYRPTVLAERDEILSWLIPGERTIGP